MKGRRLVLAALISTAPVPALAAEAARLEDRWLFATELRVGADLGLARAADVVPELTALVARYP